jgi:hypothetical protein
MNTDFSGCDGGPELMGRRKRRKGPISREIAKLRKMSPKARKKYWRALPAWKKAALIALGPAVLALLAASVPVASLALPKVAIVAAIKKGREKRAKKRAARIAAAKSARVAVAKTRAKAARRAAAAEPAEVPQVPEVAEVPKTGGGIAIPAIVFALPFIL